MLQTTFRICSIFFYIYAALLISKNLCFEFWLNFQLKSTLLGLLNLMKFPNSYRSNLMNYVILFTGIPFDIWISILFSTYSFNISLILYFLLLIFANFRCFLGSKSFISHSFWSFHYWSWLLYFTAAWHFTSVFVPLGWASSFCWWLHVIQHSFILHLRCIQQHWNSLIGCLLGNHD